MSKVIVRDVALLKRIRQQERDNPRLYQRGDKRFSVPLYPLPITCPEYIDVIYRAMNLKRVTYNAVHEATGVNYNRLWYWKKNRQQPRLDMLLKVYAYLGIRWRTYIPGIDN